MREGYEPIEGTERAPLEGASSTGRVAEDEQIEVTVIVRPDPTAAPIAESDQPLDRATLGRLRGAATADLEAVAALANRHGVTVESVEAERRRVVVAGPAHR